MVSLFKAQINIVLSILLIILLVHAYFNMNKKKITNRLIIWIMSLICFTLLLEIFSVLLNDSNLKQLIVLHKIVNIIGFFVAPIILFMGYIFSKEWINNYQKEKIKTNKILLIPLLVNGIATFMSYTGNGIFHINSDNIYERGPLFLIAPCVSYIYFVHNIYFIYKQRKKITHWECVIFSLLYIVPALFTSIQLKFSVYLTTWNSTAIIIMIAYIFILDDQAYRDSLTGLQNRLCYEHYAQNLFHKKLNKLHVIYIDIDDFKAINDQYGHREGDEAIKGFANLLIESFSLRKKKVIRLGGDEFLIVLEEGQREKVPDYLQNLTQNLETYNNRIEKSYRLTFSYGVACYTNPYEDMHQLLEYADKLMYEQKQNRKSSLLEETY